MGKGSSFEREICKHLSKWWTGGKRDDVFWRSQTSGGRATQRLKKGQRTYGSYGDIAAVDPIGEPLLKLWTIELKRGQYHGEISDLLECKRKPGVQCQFELALGQTYRSHKQAGSLGWLLISRPDRRPALAYIDAGTAKLFDGLLRRPYGRYFVDVCLDGQRVHLRFVGMLLEGLLGRLRPQDVLRSVRQAALGCPRLP